MVALTCSSSHGQETALSNIDDVAWLAGHWLSDVDGETVEEAWLSPRGGVMLGVNRTVKSGRPTQFEFLRIAQEDGKVVYYASPGGRMPVAFTLVEQDEHTAHFSNPEHDFPKDIWYERSEDKLKAKVTGEIDGRKVELSWEWTRV